MHKRKWFKRIITVLLALMLTFTDVSAVLPLENPYQITAYAGPFKFIGDLWRNLVSFMSEHVIRKEAKHPITSWYHGEDAYEDGEIPDTRNTSAEMLIQVLDEIVAEAYDYNYSLVEEQATDLGYDVETTLNSYVTAGNVLSGIDYAYILSVYSLKYPDNEITAEKLKKDMEEIIPNLVTIEYADAVTTQYEAVPFYKYKEVSVTICNESYGVVGHEPDIPIDTDGDGIDDDWESGDPIYGYIHSDTTEDFYVIEKDASGEPVIDFMIYQEDGRLVPDYQLVDVKEYDPDCDEDSQCPIIYDTYYVKGDGEDGSGMIRKFPVPINVEYGQVTATAFTNGDIWDILGLDKDERFFNQMSEKTKTKDGVSAPVPDFENGLTNFEMAQLRYEMFKELYSIALTTAYTEYRAGLTKEQIEAYLQGLPAGTSGNRKQILKTALVMVNQLPYCNNGEDSKPKKAGYDSTWYDYARCDAEGRPSGLDSSGFVQWVFWTAGFSQSDVANLRTTSLISNKIEEITDKEKIKPGDIGLVTLAETSEDTEKYNRVGIYLGDDKWIVNSSNDGTVIISSSESFNSIKVFSERMEGDDLWSEDIIFYAGGTAEIGGNGESSLYTICQIILQECDDQSSGTFAVAECVKNRAVDHTDFAGVNTAWDVLTQKGQFEAYGSGAYKNKKPSSAILTRVRQVFDGKLTVLNNSHVLYFVSKKYHEENYGKPGNFRNSLSVFGNYGGNIYYIDPKYQYATAVIGATAIYDANLSTEQIAAIKQSMGAVSPKAQEVVTFAASCVGKIPYYWGGKAGSVKAPAQMGFGAPTAPDGSKYGRSKKGLDCSGFVSYVLNYTNAASPPLGLCCSEIPNMGWKKISGTQLQPGDIGVKYGSTNHTGIYAGGGMWIHCAGNPTNNVTYNSYNGFVEFYRPY